MISPTSPQSETNEPLPEIRVDNNELTETNHQNTNDSEYNASAESNASSRRGSYDYPQYQLTGRSLFGTSHKHRADNDNNDIDAEHQEITGTDSEVRWYCWCCIVLLCCF